MGILGGLIKTLLPVVPKPLVGRVASRYVAGETVAGAVATVRELNAEGACTTLDILGEDVTEPQAARRFAADYLELIDTVRAETLDSSVSVKLSMLGLRFDRALCRDLLERLCARGAEQRVYLTIDMEDSSLTDATLELWRELHERYGNVGCVLQAYMHRTPLDIEALPSASNVRLCKGIYVEPEEIAFKGRQQIRAAYMAALEQLVAGGHYAGIATHDEWLIRRAEQLIVDRELSRDRYEFQMLLGVRADLRRRLIAAGHDLRVYVPYGADWYAYSMRRLRENPAVAWHVMRAMCGLK